GSPTLCDGTVVMFFCLSVRSVAAGLARAENAANPASLAGSNMAPLGLLPIFTNLKQLRQTGRKHVQIGVFRAPRTGRSGEAGGVCDRSRKDRRLRLLLLAGGRRRTVPSPGGQPALH